MKKLILLPAIALLLTAGLAWAPAAEAASGWVFGAAFKIGGVHFSIGYRDHGRYYYRTPIELGRAYYGRPHRSEGCYRHGGHYYHGQSCPLIHDYFRRHGYSANEVFYHHAPHDRGYRDHHRNYRHHDYRSRSYRDYRYRDYRHRDYRYHRGSSCRRY